jgi:hypothetical protein
VLYILQTSLMTLSAKVTGLFTEVEGGSFKRHLATVLPLIEQNIDPEKFVQVSQTLFILCCNC